MGSGYSVKKPIATAKMFLATSFSQNKKKIVLTFLTVDNRFSEFDVLLFFKLYIKKSFSLTLIH